MSDLQLRYIGCGLEPYIEGTEVDMGTFCDSISRMSEPYELDSVRELYPNEVTLDATAHPVDRERIIATLARTERERRILEVCDR
jgi:hypothetical protein